MVEPSINNVNRPLVKINLEESNKVNRQLVSKKGRRKRRNTLLLLKDYIVVQ